MKPALNDPADEYLSRAFGKDADEIQSGTTEGSFECERHGMPARHEVRTIGKSVGPLDAYLLRRGLVPKVMEEKWFVHYLVQTNELYIRRSWTGFLIFIVRFQPRGDDLYTETITVNRDPEQYAGTDTDYDLRLAEWVMFSLVCGGAMEFPSAAAAM